MGVCCAAEELEWGWGGGRTVGGWCAVPTGRLGKAY